MMEDIIDAFHIRERKELDPDVACDYNFIVGDLNYRLLTTYKNMVANGQLEDASSLID